MDDRSVTKGTEPKSVRAWASRDPLASPQKATRDNRVSLAPAAPEDAIRALLRTRPKD